MKREYILFSMLSALFALNAPLSAAVFERDWKTPGDGLLTYDDGGQREWLDLTETQMFKFPGAAVEEKYQAIINETAPGGMFAGFTPGVRTDVIALAVSAGIDPGSFDGTDGSNGIPSRALIELLSPTHFDSGPPESLASTGFLNEFDGADRLLGTIFVGIDGRTGLPRGGVTFFVNRQGQESSGAWLYRQIPEPSTGLLCVVVCSCYRLRTRRL
jgi:hypothetical protein